MYAMIRRYRMATGSIDDLMHKVDTQYADRLQEQLSILNYQAIDTGDGTIVTVTVFEDEERYRRSEAAAARVREGLAEFRVEEIDALAGEVMVSRARKCSRPSTTEWHRWRAGSLCWAPLMRSRCLLRKSHSERTVMRRGFAAGVPIVETLGERKLPWLTCPASRSGT